MWINLTIFALTRVLGLIILPIALVTMNLGGCLIGCLSIVGALVLLAFSLIWLPICLWLVALSRLYAVAPWLSPLIGILGIPVAVVGFLYTDLLPSMGEFGQKWQKQSICESFPYSQDFFALYSFTEKVCPREPGQVFNFRRLDLRSATEDDLVEPSLAKRWQRILELPAFRHQPGPLRADQA